ncbi:MAG: N-acetylneuraminate synthase family protein [Candidatus Hydrogenedentes bacterium]|nr:N-acetylneuraminate synthase family protein [Candidatus Hydrogenedentota bacterium]
MSDLFKSLFILDLANNHQGDVDHALTIINAIGKLARTRGVRMGFKFQYRDVDTLIHPDYRERDDVKHIPRFLSTWLKPEQYFTLVDAVRDQGMIPISTPFDEPSVRQCVDHGIQIIKVASCSAKDWPLLEAIAETGKPTIISTGGLNIYDIDNIVSFFTHREIEFALMHCVAIYPTPNAALQMNFLSKMIKRYRNVPIGYSGHETPDNLDPVKAAVSKGATMLERHVGLETDQYKLNKYSLNPEQADLWVQSALAAKEICGPEGEKQIQQTELDSLLSLKRGLYAAKNIKEGSRIERKDVFFAMPCVEGQTTSGDFGQKSVTYTASKEYNRNEPISEHRQPDAVSMVRGIIHDAKGMIYEAGIVIGNDITIELSHHFGIEHFRQIGALIVNVINREYCKKIVVLLAGQRHPNHYHKIKEETFQLLWGEMKVEMSQHTVMMKPGDKVLVERGMWHAFSTNVGAIFEEISTTHVRDDSYYEDERIAKLDPMERKSVIDNW